MITNILKTTEGKLKVIIPSTLDEITIGMLLGLTEDLSEVEVISVLSGIDKEQLYNVRNIDDFSVFQEHVLSLVHQISYVYQDIASKVPKKITLCGKTIEVINNLSVEPAGAFMNCKDIIADEINACMQEYGEEEWKNHFKPSLKAAIKVLAQYLYCPITGKPYNEFNAEAFETEVMNLPITQALPIAALFFLSYPTLQIPKISYWQLFKSQLKKKQALRNLKYSGITTQSTALRKGTLPNGMK